jgi:hypothetical protein
MYYRYKSHTNTHTHTHTTHTHLHIYVYIYRKLLIVQFAAYLTKEKALGSSINSK